MILLIIKITCGINLEHIPNQVEPGGFPPWVVCCVCVGNLFILAMHRKSFKYVKPLKKEVVIIISY